MRAKCVLIALEKTETVDEECPGRARIGYLIVDRNEKRGHDPEIGLHDLSVVDPKVLERDGDRGPLGVCSKRMTVPALTAVDFSPEHDPKPRAFFRSCAERQAVKAGEVSGRAAGKRRREVSGRRLCRK